MAIFEATDPDLCILRAEMALELSARGIELRDGRDPMSQVLDRPMEILHRAQMYPEHQREWMMRRAEAVVEAGADYLHDRGETGLHFVNKFGSLEPGRPQAPRPDAALITAAGGLEVANVSTAVHILEERIPRYLVEAQRTDIRIFALSRVGEYGVDLWDYVEATSDMMQHYKGNPSRFNRGEQWHKDHLSDVVGRAYLANGDWLRASHAFDNVDNRRKRGNGLVGLWLKLEAADDDEQNTPAYRARIREEIGELREKMQYPPLDSPAEYEHGWRELSLGLSRMYVRTGEFQAARQYIDEVLERGVIDQVPVGRALINLYGASGLPNDRAAAVQFMTNYFHRPQTVVEAATSIADADMKPGFMSTPVPKGTLVDHAGVPHTVPHESGLGLPQMLSDVTGIVDNAGIIAEPERRETISQLFAHATGLMMENGGSQLSGIQLMSLQRLIGSDRPGELRTLLSVADMTRREKEADWVRVQEIEDGINGDPSEPAIVLDEQQLLSIVRDSVIRDDKPF